MGHRSKVQASIITNLSGIWIEREDLADRFEAKTWDTYMCVDDSHQVVNESR
ncbi:hypothetical protein M422DRAFT_36774 [Sphaerobolus stellatus SS14]|uniref:Uncharacterized protein n=1 Tax=Sphaerobolus stellatus (strain SS14) TaxID=990650 RepID=A0A0C9U2Y1_SPHS4|nr:hypothetical protein M422DRAFT_37305 [Sphaerobolus stellatus SS14]KIJ29949.1 hypothetical protein M422DRAFT_36774 [Sphaerobolus stellatus SS14]